MPKNEELTGVFSGVKWSSCDDGPDRFVIAALDDDNETTVKGLAAKGELKPGLTYRFLGRWQHHDKYGKSFAFNSFCVSQPANERGIIQYLRRCPGFGPQRANLAYGLWREDAVRTIREQPDEASKQIKGLTAERAQKAAEWLRSHKAMERLLIELTSLLDGRGFPKTLQRRVISRWGEDAPQIIRERPYSLLEFNGVGWAKSDRLYLELGYPPDSIERQALCAWNALVSDSEGHTWLPKKVCLREIEKHISGANLNGDAAIEWAAEHDVIRVREECGIIYCADSRNADGESALATYAASALAEIDEADGWPDFGRLRWPSLVNLREPAAAGKKSD